MASGGFGIQRATAGKTARFSRFSSHRGETLRGGTSHSGASFRRRMNFIADLVSRNIVVGVQNAALRAGETAVASTPVKTGAARASWNATVDAPNPKSVEAPLGEDVEVSAAAEAASAEALINIANGVARFTRLNRAIYVSNGNPYIVNLDQGSSRQAPSGMSRAAVLAALDSLRRSHLLRA